MAASSLLLNSARSRTPHLLARSQSRLLSTVNRQRPLLARREPVPRSRNYWWSSSKTPVPTPAPPLQPETVVEASSVSVTSPPAEPVPDSTPVVDATPVADASQVPPDATDVLPDATQALSDASQALADASTSTAAEALSAISPLYYGDLAALGLAGWTPAGLCRWGMEALHVSTGMPWFWTIVTATVLTRVLLFPITVKSLRNTAALTPHQPELAALREEMAKANAQKDPLAMQRAVLKQRVLYNKIGISMPVMVATPFIQLPVTLGMFFGVKKLCEFPVEQLKWSGLDILPDLTAMDPTHTLPVLAALAMNFQLSLGMRDMTAGPHVPHLVNLFRVLSVGSVLFMMNFASGILVYLVTSIGAMSLQTIILRIPAVRMRLGIPIVPAAAENKPASMRESIQYVQKWWAKQKQEQLEAARAQRRR